MLSAVLPMASEVRDRDNKAMDAAAAAHSSRRVSAAEDNNDYCDNPLLNEVVVRNVFSYLHQTDLKSCRLVNSFWNKLSAPFLKLVCANIAFNGESESWPEVAKDHKFTEMRAFIECVQASADFPFSRLRIDTSGLGDTSQEQVLADFFLCISSWVTGLSVRHKLWKPLFVNEEGRLKNLVFTSLKKLTLRLSQLSTTKEEEARANFNFLKGFMHNAPSLESLTLDVHYGLDGNIMTYFIDALEMAADYHRKQISSLELIGRLEDRHLRQLSKLGLKLKSLTLHVWKSNIETSCLRAFLESQSRTLQKFTLREFNLSSCFMVDFPRMAKLKSLVVVGSASWGRINISFPNISYAAQFPVLRRLVFSSALGEWDEFLKFGIEPVNTVEELQLPGDCDFDDEAALLHAARLFPKIKKLKISALLNIANVVYEAMPNLEELVLVTKYVDLIDDIITGLTSTECEEMKNLSEESFKQKEVEHMNGITATKPISCLHKLKILRLKNKLKARPVELTDVSCRLVLMKMNSLKCLDFWGRHPSPNRISEQTLAEMRKRFLVL